METVIGVIIVALLGGILYFRDKAEKAQQESKIAKAEGRDQELVIQQEEIEEFIETIDKTLDEIKKNKKKPKDRKNMTLKEIADEAKKRYES